MKRIYRHATRIVGNTLREPSAAIAAVTMAVARFLQLLTDELPARVAGTMNVLEWTAGGLALGFIFLDKFEQRREKHHG